MKKPATPRRSYSRSSQASTGINHITCVRGHGDLRDHSALPVDSAAQPPPSRWRDLVGEGLLSATAGLCLVEMTAGLQTFRVATIPPRRVRDIGGLQLYGLVFSGYMLAGIVSIPASGADADRHGPARPLFLYSGYFLIGPVLAALAPSMPLLVVARLIQGYGGGAMYSLAYGIVPRLYPAQLRPKMLALLSGGWVVAGLLGPPFGRLLARPLGSPPPLAAPLPPL